MAERAKLFILAGEPSGDRIAADLVERLRRERPLEVLGVGGVELIHQGLTSLFSMSDLSVMGLSDVLKRLPLLLWRIRQTRNAILRSQPDVVVLVDAQVFSATVAKQLRQQGYKKPIILYVAPSVWAWKPERAGEIKPLFDEVLAVLPFEPAAMARLGGPLTTYVGHPAVDATTLRAHQPRGGPLLLLPGSRSGELIRHLPLIRAAADAVIGHSSVTGLVLPTPPSQEAWVRASVASWPMKVEVISGEEAKRDAFRRALAAVAVTGTVTLELALAGVPMVTTYVADAAQMKRAIKYNVRYLALPNILADEELVPELVGTETQPDRLSAALQDLLSKPERMDRQRAGFARIRSRMEIGDPDAPVTDPVSRVLAYLP